MVSLTGYGDTASAAGDYQLAGIHQRADGTDFNDLGRFGRGNHTTVAAACILLHDIAVFFLCSLGLFFCHKVADWLGRRFKCRVIGVDSDLSDHGSYRDIVDIAVIKLFS